MKDPDTLAPILGIEPLVGCDEDKDRIVPHVVARTSRARSMDIQARIGSDPSLVNLHLPEDTPKGFLLGFDFEHHGKARAEADRIPDPRISLPFGPILRLILARF